MSQYLVPFTVALVAQFKHATAVQSEEALALAQLEAMWLNDGVEYIYAQSETMAEIHEEDDAEEELPYEDWVA